MGLGTTAYAGICGVIFPVPCKTIRSTANEKQIPEVPADFDSFKRKRRAKSKGTSAFRKNKPLPSQGASPKLRRSYRTLWYCKYLQCQLVSVLQLYSRTGDSVLALEYLLAYRARVRRKILNFDGRARNELMLIEPFGCSWWTRPLI
jgi:hypothetical protein